MEVVVIPVVDPVLAIITIAVVDIPVAVDRISTTTIMEEVAIMTANVTHCPTMLAKETATTRPRTNGATSEPNPSVEPGLIPSMLVQMPPYPLFIMADTGPIMLAETSTIAIMEMENDFICSEDKIYFFQHIALKLFITFHICSD